MGTVPISPLSGGSGSLAAVDDLHMTIRAGFQSGRGAEAQRGGGRGYVGADSRHAREPGHCGPALDRGQNLVGVREIERPAGAV